MSITNVARLAGVSSSTVSRVINNRPRVSRETIRVVHEAMAKLNYVPSEDRPGPKPGGRVTPSRVATIGLFVIGSSGDRVTPAFEELMRGVSKGAAACGLKLVYHHSADFSTLPGAIANGQIDGLLLHGALPPPGMCEQLRQYPTVWLMSNRRRPDWGDQVMPDTYEIGQRAAGYLLARGHRNLAFFNLDQNHWPFRVTWQSFNIAALSADAAATPYECVADDEEAHRRHFGIDAAEGLVARYLDSAERPTGIFVAEDMQAAIIQPALQRAGVQIGPGKVEIISCNNERLFIDGLTPKPAEIDIRVETIGYRGVQRLLVRLKNRDAAERMVTAVEPYVISHGT